jgi:hypothetical protein
MDVGIEKAWVLRNPGGVAKETSMYDGKRGSPMGQHESRQSV